MGEILKITPEKIPLTEKVRLNKHLYKSYEHHERFVKWIEKYLLEISGVQEGLMGKDD